MSKYTVVHGPRLILLDNLMQLFNFEVRKDWQEIDLNRTVEYAKLWRLIQVAIILSTMAVFFLTLANFVEPWGGVLQGVLTFGFFLTFSLWTVYRSRPNTYRTTLLVGLFFVGAAAIVGYTAVLPARSGIGPFSSFWGTLAVLLVPGIGLAVLFQSQKRYPDQMKELGLSLDHWPINLLIGVAAGGSIGLHFLLTTYFLPGIGDKFAPNLGSLFWTLCYRVGFAALGEELILRGLSFKLLYEDNRNSLWRTSAVIALLNIVMYIVPATQVANVTLVVWLIVYRLIFSFAVTFLRYRQRTLLPCIAGNVIFNLVLTTVGG